MLERDNQQLPQSGESADSFLLFDCKHPCSVGDVQYSVLTGGDKDTKRAQSAPAPWHPLVSSFLPHLLTHPHPPAMADIDLIQLFIEALKILSRELHGPNCHIVSLM